MNGALKIILGIIAAILVICLFSAVGGFLLLRSTGRALANGLETDPAKAVQVSSSIADYTIPDGFGKPYATRVAGFSLVAYTGDGNHSHIYLVQLPKLISLDQAEIERQLHANAPAETYDQVNRMVVVDRQTVTIRGQEVTLLVSEGTNHEGQTFREVSGMFQGKGGQALVNVSAPTPGWDQAEIDTFLASIH